MPRNYDSFIIVDLTHYDWLLCKQQRVRKGVACRAGEESVKSLRREVIRQFSISVSLRNAECDDHQINLEQHTKSNYKAQIITSLTERLYLHQENYTR